MDWFLYDIGLLHERVKRKNYWRRGRACIWFAWWRLFNEGVLFRSLHKNEIFHKGFLKTKFEENWGFDQTTFTEEILNGKLRFLWSGLIIILTGLCEHYHEGFTVFINRSKSKFALLIAIINLPIQLKWWICLMFCWYIIETRWGCWPNRIQMDEHGIYTA